MNNSYLYNAWKKVCEEVSNTSEDQIMVYRPFVECYFGMTYIGANANKTKFLIIELNETASDKFVAPNVKGLTFETTRIGKINPDHIYLKIGATEEMDLEQAFEAFAVSLVDKIKNVPNYFDVLEIIYEVVDKFSTFFGEKNSKKLSSIEQQGIFGELTFLNSVIDKYGESFVKYWTGTEKNKHDFIFNNNVGVEIKTTLSQTQRNITISNENQLNFEERLKLFLNVYVLESNLLGKTIIELAKEIDSKLFSIEAKKLFRLKLLEDGISLVTTETNLRYIVVRENAYLISNDFPRIDKSQISERLFNVSYKLNIDGIETYKGEILDDIR